MFPIDRIKPFFWIMLLAHVFLRPFISEYAFVWLGYRYIFSLCVFSLFYLLFINEKSFFLSPLSFSVLLFLVIILLNIICLGAADYSLSELFFFLPNIIIFFVVSKLSLEQRKQLIFVMFTAAGIIGIYALYQHFFGFSHIVEYLKYIPKNQFAEKVLREGRIYASFISPNIFASYLIMMLFIGIGLCVSAPKKLVYWISLLIIAIALPLTKSLGAIIAFIFSFIVFISYITKGLVFKKRLSRKNTAAVIIALSIFFAFGGFFIGQRLPRFFDFELADNSIIQRLYYWQASLNMAKEHLLTGAGWRKFELLYEFYKPQYANISRYSHNLLLQITVETGLIGILSFLLIIIIFLHNANKAIKYTDREKAVNIGLFCASLAFLFHNFFDISFYFSQASFFWWIILGLFNEA